MQAAASLESDGSVLFQLADDFHAAMRFLDEIGWTTPVKIREASLR